MASTTRTILINTATLTSAQRQERMSVRNFLMIATRVELERERLLSVERGEMFRAICVQELIGELED